MKFIDELLSICTFLKITYMQKINNEVTGNLPPVLYVLTLTPKLEKPRKNTTVPAKLK